MMYTPGQNGPVDQVNNGADIQAYRPINSGFGYFAGWTDIQTGGIDYITSFMVGSTEGLVLAVVAQLRQVRADLPRRRRRLLADAGPGVHRPGATSRWTPNKVNTQSILISDIGLIPCPATITAFGAFGTHGCTSDGRGTEQFLGAEGGARA